MIELLTRVKISEVYRALTGIEPRQTGKHKFRGRASWRDGANPNVSMDDGRGVWHDFATGEGGGILDLVARIRGGNRADAFCWAETFAGVPINDTPLSLQERAHWAEERRQLEWYLPKARYWQRSATALGEQVLDGLKAALVDPKLPWPAIGEIFNAEQLLRRWKRIDGFELVEEYRWWEQHNPEMTAGLIHAAKLSAAAEVPGLRAYVELLVTDVLDGVTD